MIIFNNEFSRSKAAIVAGIGYLILIITGIFAEFFVRSNLVVPGNAAETVSNILANDALFRFGIFNFIIMVIFDVIVAWALYIFLRPINKDFSLLTAWFRLVNATIFAAALFHLFDILTLLNGAEYKQVFEQSSLNAQVMLMLDSFNNTWLVGLIFFGLHLYFLGYLVIKSGFIPKIIGILLMVAASGYLIDSFANFLFTSYEDYKSVFLMIVAVPGIIGELSFALWLIIKGRKLPDLKQV